MMRKMITEWDEYVFIFICVFILRFFLFAKSMTDFFLFGLFSYSFYVYFGENWRMRVWFDPVSFTMNHNYTHTHNINMQVRAIPQRSKRIEYKQTKTSKEETLLKKKKTNRTFNDLSCIQIF